MCPILWTVSLVRLVSITASCAVVRPWESIIIGGIGAVFAIFAHRLMDKLKIDDPVGAVPVHCVCGIWGMLAVGLFADNDPLEDTTQGRSGLFHGGGMYLLGVQTLAVVCIVAWSGVTSAIILYAIKVTIGLRLTEEQEELGADYVEHGIGMHTSTQVSESGFPSTSTSTCMCSGSIHIQSGRTTPSTILDDRNNTNLLIRRNSMTVRSNKVVPIDIFPGQVQDNTSLKDDTTCCVTLT